MDYVTQLLDTIDQNFERGMLTEQQRDEAIDDVIREQNESARQRAVRLGDTHG